MKSAIYLDYNATTPVHVKVLEEMTPFFSDLFGNAASSAHAYGWRAKDAVEKAAENISQFIGCIPQELTFTSGATESINLAIKGVFFKYKRKGKHIILLSTEHKAVLDTCNYLSKHFDAEITVLDVNMEGLIDLNELTYCIREDTILVCCMLVNNETGVIQPLSKIAAIVHKKKSIILCDATQAVGKIGVDVNELGADLLAFSAHKFYGPKGVGALFVRRKNPRVVLDPQIHGGGHQRNLRSGTLNVPGIVGLSAACTLARKSMSKDETTVGEIRNKMEDLILHDLHFAQVNSSKSPRVYNTSSISFVGLKATDIIRHCKSSLAISTGSACSSESLEPSHVLMAMFNDKERALSTVRFSLGKFVNEEELLNAIKILIGQLKKLSSKS